MSSNVTKFTKYAFCTAIGSYNDKHKGNVTVEYGGTVSNWNSITKNSDWNSSWCSSYSGTTFTVKFKDGTTKTGLAASY